MAEPTDTYPETATNGARKEATDGDGEAALRAALADHGDELAGVVENTDELNDVLTTAILVIASSDEADLDHVTDRTANLIAAADGLATNETADLAADVGDSAADLSAALDTVLELQRDGHLDDFVTLSSAFSDSLSSEEVEELATMLEANGSDLVAALDTVLELQRDDHLSDLVDLATTLSVLDIDEDTAAGLNDILGAVGEAQRESEPAGPLGMLRGLASSDGRAGLGYLLAILKAQGRRLRER